MANLAHAIAAFLAADAEKKTAVRKVFQVENIVKEVTCSRR